MSGTSSLFKPINIGNVKIKNRVMMLPMAGGDARDYVTTPEVVDFYEKRARGGTGLIIIGGCMVTDFRGAIPSYTSVAQNPGIFSDDLLPGLRRLTEAAHKHGCKIGAQLSLQYEWRSGPDAPIESVGPSSGPSAPHIPPMRELSVAEIKQIIQEYAGAAIRARHAGFDLVEIHAGIGYFLNRFLSSYSNKRTDEYGGSLQNRMRFLLEVIDAVHKQAGDDYPCTCRISADEFMEGGNTLADTLQIAPDLEKAGVCALNIQAGFHESARPLIQKWTPQGAYAYLAEAVKKVVNIPVIAGYRIVSPQIAEKIVSGGQADMIGMARALIADPEWANKVFAGKKDDICSCICCCRCLDDRRDGNVITCSVNTQVSKPDWKPADVKKKVLVVGGGPSGMEAARIAALRGHEVTLYDENPRLGGLTLLASVLNPELEDWVKYIKKQLKSLPIQIKLKSRVTTATINELRPDVVVLSAGGVYPAVSVPGAKSNKVLSGHDIMDITNGRRVAKGLIWEMGALVLPHIYSPSLMRWALGLNFPVKNRVVIIGGGFAGCELAEVLTEKGHKVTMLEKSSRIGSDVGMTERWWVKILLKQLEVDILTNTVVEEITSRGVRIRTGDASREIDADTIITAEKLAANSKIFGEISKGASEIYPIGDCNDPGRIREATSSGFRIGCEI